MHTYAYMHACSDAVRLKQERLKQERALHVSYLSVSKHSLSLARAPSLLLSPSRSLSFQRQMLLLQMQVEHKTKAKSLARLPDICVLDDKSVQERLAKLKA